MTEGLELKEKYLKLIHDLGYKMMYDLDKDCDNDLFDIYCLLTYTDKEAPINKKKYIFCAISRMSALSLSEFKKYLPGGPNQASYNEFVRGLRNRLALEYEIDDVAAILLHNNYHLEEFYKFVQGKPRLILDPEMIQLLVDEGSQKGSPLENRDARLRALKKQHEKNARMPVTSH